MSDWVKRWELCEYWTCSCGTKNRHRSYCRRCDQPLPMPEPPPKVEPKAKPKPPARGTPEHWLLELAAERRRLDRWAGRVATAAARLAEARQAVRRLEARLQAGPQPKRPRARARRRAIRLAGPPA